MAEVAAVATAVARTYRGLTEQLIDLRPEKLSELLIDEARWSQFPTAVAVAYCDVFPHRPHWTPNSERGREGERRERRGKGREEEERREGEEEGERNPLVQASVATSDARLLAE